MANIYSGDHDVGWPDKDYPTPYTDLFPTVNKNMDNVLVGGKLEGTNHYYTAKVVKPINPDISPYIAECSDIIEALDMSFNEGEAFKAIWRLAAARQGRGKPGNSPVYDADKVAHYGSRVAAQVKQKHSNEQTNLSR